MKLKKKLFYSRYAILLSSLLVILVVTAIAMIVYRGEYSYEKGHTMAESTEYADSDMVEEINSKELNKYEIANKYGVERPDDEATTNTAVDYGQSLNSSSTPTPTPETASLKSRFLVRGLFLYMSLKVVGLLPI